MNKAHSSIGPSSADRWMNCPGSVALSASLPKPPSNEYAAEGSVAHSIAEGLVTGKLNEEAISKLIGTTRRYDGFEIEITEDMLGGAMEYRDLIEADKQMFELDERPMEVVGKAETRVCAKNVDVDLWGTCDYFLYRKGNKLIVYDYKFGKGVLYEAEQNEQLIIYAIAIMDTEAGWAYDEVELVIHQPRALHVEGTERRWKTTIEWLRQFRNSLTVAIKAVRDPKAQLEPGKWCRWCPAKASCPALVGEIQRQAQVDFAMVPARSQGLPDAKVMPIERLASALKWEKAIESWYESLKERVREILSAGQTVPGFKLVNGKSNRKWISEDQVAAEFASVLGEEKLYEKKMLSPAKLEKIVGKGVLEKKNLTFKPEPPKAIAPDSDPRPAAKSSAEEDFGQVNGKAKKDDKIWP